MNSLPKFLQSGVAEPKFSTKEYWNKHKFAILLHPSKIQVGKLLQKQSDDATSLSEKETLNLQICKASSMMSIGYQAVKEIQARNHKEDVFDKDQGKMAGNMEVQRTSKQNSVKVMQAKREKSETLYQFWTRLSRLAVKCGIESLSNTEIENALQVASFTIGVKDEEIVKLILEKKLSFAELDKVIKDSQEATEIMKQNQKVVIEQESIGRVKKEKLQEKKLRKKLCIRCGDNY